MFWIDVVLDRKEYVRGNGSNICISCTYLDVRGTSHESLVTWQRPFLRCSRRHHILNIFIIFLILSTPKLMALSCSSLCTSCRWASSGRIGMAKQKDPAETMLRHVHVEPESSAVATHRPHAFSSWSHYCSSAHDLPKCHRDVQHVPDKGRKAVVVKLEVWSARPHRDHPLRSQNRDTQPQTSITPPTSHSFTRDRLIFFPSVIASRKMEQTVIFLPLGLVSRSYRTEGHVGLQKMHVLNRYGGRSARLQSSLPSAFSLLLARKSPSRNTEIRQSVLLHEIRAHTGNTPRGLKAQHVRRLGGANS